MSVNYSFTLVHPVVRCLIGMKLVAQSSLPVLEYPPPHSQIVVHPVLLLLEHLPMKTMILPQNFFKHEKGVFIHIKVITFLVTVCLLPNVSYTFKYQVIQIKHFKLRLRPKSSSTFFSSLLGSLKSLHYVSNISLSGFNLLIQFPN